MLDLLWVFRRLRLVETGLVETNLLSWCFGDSFGKPAGPQKAPFSIETATGHRSEVSRCVVDGLDSETA